MITDGKVCEIFESPSLGEPEPSLTKDHPLKMVMNSTPVKICKSDIFSLQRIHGPGHLGAFLEKSIN
jgi:hypothetical protein